MKTVGFSEKLKAVAASGALTVVVVYVLGQLSVDVPPEVAAAGATLFSILVGSQARADVVAEEAGPPLAEDEQPPDTPAVER